MEDIYNKVNIMAKKESGGGKVSKWKQKLANQPEPEKVGPRAQTNTGKSNIANLVLTLQIHNQDYSKEDVLLNSDQFEGALKEGDFMEISLQSQAGLQQTLSSLSSTRSSPQIGLSQTSSSNLNGTGQKKMIVRIGKDSIRSQRFQISILKNIADSHNLKSNAVCKVRLLLPEPTVIEKNSAKANKNESEKTNLGDDQSIAPYAIDRVEITFRDQLLSRRDMWKIQKFLENKGLYKNKQLEFMGIRFVVRNLFNADNQEIFTGVVKQAKTKFFYYSKSSQVYILLELSEEMYQFDENGILNHEKCIQFLKAYFERCVKSASTHEVSIVIYSRLYYPQVKNKEELRDALSKYYKTEQPLDDLQIDQLGAFQISKHTKVFQDIYMKVGVFEIGRGNWEKNLQNLKKYFLYLPSMINWTINCPKHVEDLKRYYPRQQLSSSGSFLSSFEDFQANFEFTQDQSHYMLGCRVGNAEKQNVLEAINLALFNLNNEEEDQNLKQTGQQLLIVTAGIGTYRINANVIEPTKSRVVLGGIPIQIISLNKKPLYRTPLLVNCCTYTNPFKTKQIKSANSNKFQINLATQLSANFSQGQSASPTSFNSKYNPSSLLDSSTSSPIKKQQCDDSNTNPPYYYPYWLEIFYLPQTKYFEVHGATISNPQAAVYRVQKIPPYFAQHSEHDFEPHTEYSFLNAISNLEEKLVKDKLMTSNNMSSAEIPDETIEEESKVDEQRRVVINTSDYSLKAASLSSIEKSELALQLEKEDAMIFKQKDEILKQQSSFKKRGLAVNRQKVVLDSQYSKRKELQSENKRKSFNIEENVDDQIVVRSQISNDEGGAIDESDQYTIDDEKSNLYYNQTVPSQFAQSLQEKKSSLEDFITQRDPYEEISVQKGYDHNKAIIANHGFNFKQSVVEHPSEKFLVVPGNQQKQQPRMNSITFSPAQETAISVPVSYHYDPFSPKSNTEESTISPQVKVVAKSQKPKIKPFMMDQPKEQIAPTKKKQSSLKNRWSNQASIINLQSQLSDQQLEVLLHYGSTQQLELVMDSFWRSLCECKLLPLTINYFPDEVQLMNKKYHNDIQYVIQTKTGLIRSIEEYLNEYICLRLTQNFQIYTQDQSGNVDFQGILLRRNDIKMSMGNKYNIFSAQDKENFKIKILTKMTEDEAHIVRHADFKYMLFNFHTNRFQVKTSSENRLFNFKSLLNLGEVLNDHKSAMKSCIKMPQNHFVIFFQNTNWIFSNQQRQKNQPLFPVSDYSSNSSAKQSFATSEHPSLSMSQSMRSATIDISKQTNEMTSGSLQSLSQYHGSMDLNSQAFNNQLSQQLQQIYREQGADMQQFEIDQFLMLRSQLFDMLTRNKQSIINTKANMSSIEQIEISKPQICIYESELKPYEPTKIASTVFIEDDSFEKAVGAYFLTHDSTFQPSHCFHITISWIFANGPQIQEKINSLKRKVRSCGMQIIQISGVANKDELNPFENFTLLKSVPVSLRRENPQYPYMHHKISVDSYQDDDAQIEYNERIQQKRCTLFTRRFEYFLRNYYGFVIESENKIYRNYIHFSGIAVIRIYHTSDVAWIENDVVNNQLADYSESHRVQEKVDLLIFALDLILDIAFDKIIKNDAL